MLLKASFNRRINKYAALEALMYFLQVIFPLRNNTITIPVPRPLVWAMTMPAKTRPGLATRVRPFGGQGVRVELFLPSRTPLSLPTPTSPRPRPAQPGHQSGH